MRLSRNTKAVLFDLDGTLLDSSQAIMDAVEHVLTSKGFHCYRPKVAEMIGIPLENIFAVLAPNLSTEEVWNLVLEYRKYYMIHHLERTSIHPSTRLLLQKLKEKGLKLGIITGKYREPTINALDYFGISGFFDTVVTGYDIKNHKPAPDIVLKAAKRLGISPKECVVVGDSPTDVEAGKRAGSHTIALITDAHSRLLLKKANPTIIIENLAALEDVHF